MKTVKIKKITETLSQDKILTEMNSLVSKFKLRDEIILNHQSQFIREEDYSALHSYVLNPFNPDLNGNVSILFHLKDKTFYGKRENVVFERMKEIKNNSTPIFLNKRMNKTQKIFYILCNRILMYNGYDYYTDFTLSKNSYLHSLRKVFDVADLSKYILKVGKDLSPQDKKDFLEVFKNKQTKMENIKYFFESNPIEYNVYCYKNKATNTAMYLSEEYIFAKNIKIIMSLSLSIMPVPIFFGRAINIKIAHNASEMLKIMEKVNSLRDLKEEIRKKYSQIDWARREKEVSKFAYETHKFLSHYKENPPTQEMLQTNFQFRALEHSFLLSNKSNLPMYFKDAFENQDLEISSSDMREIILKETADSEEI